MSKLAVEHLPNGEFNLLITDDNGVEHRTQLDTLLATPSSEDASSPLLVEVSDLSFNRHVMQQTADIGAATRTVVGMTLPPANTGTITSSDDADGPWQLLTSGAVSGNEATMYSTTAIKRQWEPIVFGSMKTPASLAAIRFNAGLVEGALESADCPTGAEAVYFEYDSAQHSTEFWRCVTHDAVDTSGAAGACSIGCVTSVPVLPNTVYRWAIRLLSDRAEFYMAIGSDPLLLVCTTSQKLPAAATPLAVLTRVLTNEAVAKAMKWGRHSVIQKT